MVIWLTKNGWMVEAHGLLLTRNGWLVGGNGLLADKKWLAGLGPMVCWLTRNGWLVWGPWFVG